MPEHLLQIADIGADIVQQRRHRVPNDVHAPRLLDVGLDDVLPEPLSNLGGPDAAPQALRKRACFSGDVIERINVASCASSTRGASVPT